MDKRQGYPSFKILGTILKVDKGRQGNIMTMHPDLHPSDDIDRLYVSGKEEGRGLVSIYKMSIHLYDDSKTT